MTAMNLAKCEAGLKLRPRQWLITGVAGFIGSHLLARLLGLGQSVVGVDNFSTSRRSNLDSVYKQVTSRQWERFRHIEGDIRDAELCQNIMQGVEFVLHQAALGSVPRSISDPAVTHANNVTGFLNILIAARDAQVRRFVYASSSSVFGDAPGLPKVENTIGAPLSPYAAGKYMNELYAKVFGRCYGIETIGLRYFNVFGPRQDPEGPYAAVIPLWFRDLIQRQPVYINGDGETSRDFCYVDNAVQVNLLAACAENPEALNQTYNVAVGQQTTLKQLFGLIQTELRVSMPLPETQPTYREFRDGDIRHSLADISKAKRLLGYAPTHSVSEGLRLSAPFYIGEANAASVS